MQSPYLIQALAEAHIEDLHRSAAVQARARRRGRRRGASPVPRLRAWWVGQLRRPVGGAARSGVLPGRPVTHAVPCGSAGR
ncbi:MAG TPA: hypothetical protein VFJ98_00160 [Mycobacteriales bacterium]|nr:hypothetical protein [Mycobacteriales bacterium]